MIKKCFRLAHSVDIEADIPQILGRECSCFYYAGCASSYSLSRSRICGMPPSRSIRCTSLKYFLIIEKLDLNDVLLCLHLPSSFFNVMLVNFPKCSWQPNITLTIVKNNSWCIRSMIMCRNSANIYNHISPKWCKIGLCSNQTFSSQLSGDFSESLSPLQIIGFELKHSYEVWIEYLHVWTDILHVHMYSKKYFRLYIRKKAIFHQNIGK